MGLLLRFLAILFLLRLALRFVVAVFKGASTPTPDERRRASVATDLVRDRVCNTFLPRSSALIAAVHGETAFFCSETCRDRALLQ
jgi:hypothetical protein